MELLVLWLSYKGRCMARSSRWGHRALQIAHFGDGGGCDEDVANADVAVDEVARVEVDQAAGDLLRERRSFNVCERWSLIL